MILNTKKYTEKYMDELFVEIFLDNIEDDCEQSFFTFDEDEFYDGYTGLTRESPSGKIHHKFEMGS